MSREDIRETLSGQRATTDAILAVADDFNAPKYTNETHEETAAEMHRAADDAAKSSKMEKISTKKGLLEACFDVFGKRRSEGAVLNAYLDPKNYPTIGCGHLIWEPDSDQVSARERHVKAMTAIGINAAQAGKDFDNLMMAMKTGKIRHQDIQNVDVITNPRMTPLTSNQAKKLFIYDAERRYKEVLKNFPDLHSYPIEIQTCLMHHGYHYGNTKELKKRCQDDLSAQNVVTQMMNIREGSQYSINSACELNAAAVAAGIEPTDTIKEKINKYASSAKKYDKDVLGVLQTKNSKGNYL